MQWFTRVASWASVINVLVASLGFYWPAVTAGAARTVLLTAIIAALACINVLGIRQSAWVVNALTIGKLLPLALFIVVGLIGVDMARLAHGAGCRRSRDLSTSALLLIFAFGGYEVIPVPAGESQDPRRAVPFALIMTIVVVTLVLTLAQVVALGHAAGPARRRRRRWPTPSALFMGAAGAASSRSAPSSRRSATTWGRRCRDRAACSRSPSRATCRVSSAGSIRDSARP